MKLSMYLNNQVFRIAKGQAVKLVSNRFRLVSLLTVMGKKLNRIEDKGKAKEELKEKIFLLGRLLKASTVGQYKALPWKSGLSIVAAVIYFVNPADIIPDIIPVSGLMDDFTILLWTYNSLRSELDKFLLWERFNLNR